MKWLTSIFGLWLGDADYGNPVPPHQRRFAAGTPTRCSCHCHTTSPPAVHAQACCAPCSHCGEGFVAGIMEHEASCPARSAEA